MLGTLCEVKCAHTISVSDGGKFKQAEKILYDRNLDKEYAGMMGFESFNREAYKLAFGEDQNYKDNMVCLS